MIITMGRWKGQVAIKASQKGCPPDLIAIKMDGKVIRIPKTMIRYEQK